MGSAAPVKMKYDSIFETMEVKGPQRQPKSTTLFSFSTPPSSSSSSSSARSSSEALVFSICSDTLEKIDPRLVCQIVVPSVTDATALDYELVDVVDLTSVDEGHGYLPAQRGDAGPIQSTYITNTLNSHF